MGQQLVEQGSEGENVASSVDFAARRLFGRHVTGRADDDAGARLILGQGTVLFSKPRSPSFARPKSASLA